MEEEWYADRANLRRLMRQHPDWSSARLARALGRALSWIKQWRRGLAAAPPQDDTVLASRSRARRHAPPAIGQAVVARIRAIREQPPANLPRVPGPRAIRSFLERDDDRRVTEAPFPAHPRRSGRSSRAMGASPTRRRACRRRWCRRHR